MRLRGDQVLRFGESLELYRVATGVSQQHARLLVDATFVPSMRRDYESDACTRESLSQFRPCLDRQHRAEVGQRYRVAVDHVLAHLNHASPTVLAGADGVRDELMPEEIEVHPILAAASLPATQQIRVEAPGCGEIMDRDRQMEWCRHRPSYGGRP